MPDGNKGLFCHGAECGVWGTIYGGIMHVRRLGGEAFNFSIGNLENTSRVSLVYYDPVQVNILFVISFCSSNVTYHFLCSKD